MSDILTATFGGHSVSLIKDEGKYLVVNDGTESGVIHTYNTIKEAHDDIMSILREVLNSYVETEENG